MERNINFKKYIWLAVIAYVAIFCLWLLSSRSLVRVSVSENQPNLEVTAQMLGSEEEQSLKPGWNILSKGEYSLSAVNHVSEMRKDFQVRSFRIEYLNVGVAAQKQVKKVARGASDCIFGAFDDLTVGSVYSYECDDPTNLYVNAYDNYSKKALLRENTFIYNAQAFRDGIVGLGGNGEENTYLSFISKTANERVLTPVKATDFDYSYQLQTYDNKVYLFDKPTSTVYVYSDFTSQPLSYKLDLNISQNDQTVFRVHDQKVYVFTATKEDDRTDEVRPDQLLVFEQGKQKPINTIAVNNIVELPSDILPINDRLIAFQSIERSISLYTLTDQKMELKSTFNNVIQSSVVGNTLYTLADGNIYSYSPKIDSYNLVFSSRNIKVSRLNVTDSRLVFNGYSSRESSPTSQTYLLLNVPIKNSERLEDKLPLTNTDLTIGWMDYFENKIHVALVLDSARVGPTAGQAVYDQTEFESYKKLALDELRRRGFTESNYNITFSAY